MTQQIIDIGNVANDGQGDSIRTAFEKTNENFTELFNIGGVSGIANGTSNISIVENGNINITASGVANVFRVTPTGSLNTGSFSTTTLTATGNISTSSNVTASFFVGNGSALTGVQSSADASLLTGNTLSSNVLFSQLTSVGTLVSLVVTGGLSAGNLSTTGSVSALGNVTGANLITVGNAQVSANLNAVAVNASNNISAVGNVNADKFNANLLVATSVTGNVVSVTGNVTAGNLVTTGEISTSANITAANINATNLISSGGNVVAANVNAITVSASGNVNSAGIVSTGNVIGLGFFSDNWYYANGTQLDFQQPGGVNQNIQYNNNGDFGGSANLAFNPVTSAFTITGTASVSGNVDGGNLRTSGQVSAAGNVTAGNLSVTGNVLNALLPAANVTYDLGSSSQRWKDLYLASSTIYLGNAQLSANATALTITNPAGGITVLAGATSDITGNSISVSGNITGGNVAGGTLVNATSLTGTTLSVSGNITGGNVAGGTLVNATSLTGTTLSVSGNITGGNVAGGSLVNATSLTGTTLSMSGNITGGNVAGGTLVNATSLTGTTISASGNITGGNVAGGTLVNATSLTGTTISASGNITGGNLISTSGLSAAGLVNLGNVSNVSITGGTNGFVLTTNGSGSLSWAAQTSGETPNVITISSATSSFATANGQISTNRMIGRYNAANANGSFSQAPWFWNVTGQNSACTQPSLSDYLEYTRLAYTPSGVAGNVANLGMAVNSTWGDLKPGLGFVAGTGRDILNNSVGNPATANALTTTAVVVGWAKNGPRIVVQSANIAWNGTDPAAANVINYVASDNQFSGNLQVDGALNMNGTVAYLPWGTSDPVADFDGAIYYNNSTNKVRVRLGGVWANIVTS